ncbi:hypothetical protein JKF63_04449 [Porcisia hertigi]|uniref:Uncharacterized protein n=1 Tax=Porcisia hertigi TaxID=2761500 RepID=A0A836HSJ3_9TRYP|nr:hypothetical protein JKF63_04449 [Porcisia hertigi]
MHHCTPPAKRPREEESKTDVASSPSEAAAVSSRASSEDLASKPIADSVEMPRADKANEEPEAEEEPLQQENPFRYVLFPIKYHDIWRKYKEQESCIWTVEEIDLGTDMKDWATLNPDEQHFIKHVLAFFAGSDGIVMENLAQRFMNDVKIPEARAFYGFQLMMENIHSETYSVLLDTYITDNAEKLRLLHAIQTVPCIQKKAEWALRWIGSGASFQERLIGFAAVEGIFFSGSFCALFWMKKRGLMPGLTFSNELISRDEGLHTDFACLLYNSHIKNKLPRERVLEIVVDAVDIEMENIHSETYSVLLDTYITDNAEKLRLLHAIQTVPCIQKKAEWALRWIGSGASFQERLIGFAAVEGIFFSGSFCALFWMKKRGLMPGLTFSNELISRDEGLHTDFACLLYNSHIKNKLPRERVLEIVVDAVDIEREFICDALPVRLIGMNAELMARYIEFVADRLLVSLGEEKYYNVSQPFDFMEMISLQGKSNFFEKRVSEYQKAGVMSTEGTTKRFSTSEDF